MELSPPLLVRAPLPFGPRISHDGLFAQLAGPLVDALGGADAPLGALQRDIAGNVADGLDARWTSTIGAAEEVADTHRGAGDDQTAHALVDTGAGADAYRQSVLSAMPQPDTPLEHDFRELPGLGDGHPGSGGVDPDDNPRHPEM